MTLTRCSLALLLAAGLTLTACTDSQTETTTTTSQTETTTSEAAASSAGTEPAASASTTEAASAPAGDTEAGKTSYNASCAGCHGVGGAGGMGPALSESAAWSAEAFALAVREGQLPSGEEMKSSMPRFTEGQLSEADLANVHGYLASLN